jgi:MFS transporter, FSR family, fosmidomycin resistance protein
MTQAASAPVPRFSEMRVVAPICAAHFVSHYYMIMLAPLFAFVRADYGISYTGLALALTAFNVVSAALQTPVGFLVDRIGPRVVLISGVALGSVAFAVAGLVHSFVVFIAMYAVAGLGNTAYHPADYSLLSRTPPDRIGQVFSFHTFSGILGGAVAPVTLLAMQAHFGWRGAYVGAALLGLVVLILLLMQRPEPSDQISQKRKPTAPTDDAAGVQTREAGLKLLLSAPILLNLFYFILTSVMGGLNSFLVVALTALYGTPDTLANGALTAMLLMSALGVLIGGALAVRTKRHATVAALGLACAGVSTALVGFAGGSAFALIILTSLSGFSVGITSPSRDMLVRAVTPPGAFGRVFGFVSSGFNIGAMIAPTVYGMMMDHRAPRGLFLVSAACSILCIGTVIFGFSGREQR